jgi:transcriptional regulator with XRE-family HTH domain
MNSSQPIDIPAQMQAGEVGPYLRGLREHFGLSPQDVSARLHIRVRYVEAIESGRFEQLPGEVYARGYLHNYAEFLGLNPEQVVARCFVPLPGKPANQVHEAVRVSARPRRVPPRLVRRVRVWLRAVRRAPLPFVVNLMGAIILSLIVAQAYHALQDAQMETGPASVAPVPESWVAEMRDRYMPGPREAECLLQGRALACLRLGALPALISSWRRCGRLSPSCLWRSARTATRSCIRSFLGKTSSINAI